MKTISALALTAALLFPGAAFANLEGPPSSSSSSGGSGGGSVIYTTETVPGASCEEVPPKSGKPGPENRQYKCTIWKGFGTIMAMFGQLIKYFTYITGLVAILMIVVSGVQYSLSGGGEDAKKAKGRIIQLLSGLVLLFLVGFILNSIAPWIYT